VSGAWLGARVGLGHHEWCRWKGTGESEWGGEVGVGGKGWLGMVGEVILGLTVGYDKVVWLFWREKSVGLLMRRRDEDGGC
jgi:hypothetical protein